METPHALCLLLYQHCVVSVAKCKKRKKDISLDIQTLLSSIYLSPQYVCIISTE